MTTSENPKYILSDSITLGRSVTYKDKYTPELLQPVPRRLGREQINIEHPLPFSGMDIWNGYEVSWLNDKGMPQVAILRCYVPIDSENLIESKSFKLYLNSLNQAKFVNWKRVKETLAKDLSRCAGAQVTIELLPLNTFSESVFGAPTGTSLDNLDIEIDEYSPNISLLKTHKIRVQESLYSDLLKSNCLITRQPDWASVMIRYTGDKIDHGSLLRYLISFRQHDEFHEQCVERIFSDIKRQCKPERLTVYARYTRRGGLDINPFRSDYEQPDNDSRLPRQ